MMDRRTFFKLTGAAIAAASMPIVVAPEYPGYPADLWALIGAGTVPPA